MTVLPQLESELLTAHARLTTPHGWLVRGWMRRRGRATRTGLLLTGAVLVLAGAAAGAELLFRVGSSIPPAPQPYAIVVKGAPPGVGPTAGQAAQMLLRLGRPLPATARVYTLQPDPVGGPPWGVLVYRTSQGIVCEHAGRIVDGRVGVLDAHRALHPWLADLSGCLGIGIALHALDAQGGVLKSGGGLSCIQRADIQPGQRTRFRICSANEVRTIIEGVLGRRNQTVHGPQPVRITFTTPERRITEPTPQGAFVYVVKGDLGCTDWPKATTTYSDGMTDTQPDLRRPRCPSSSSSPQP